MLKRPRNQPKIAHRTRSFRGRLPRRQPGPTEKLHIGSWLAALELKQIDVAQRAKIGRAYLNNLINPKTPDKPPNPSALVMLRLSRVMGVSVNELYEEPPTRAELARLRRYQPATLGSLLETRS